jgi:hypothetical protein
VLQDATVDAAKNKNIAGLEFTFSIQPQAFLSHLNGRRPFKDVDLGGISSG